MGFAVNEGSAMVPLTCVNCGTVHKVQLPIDGIRKRQAGGLIQNCFPDLDPALREMMVSGFCPSCWDAIFKEEED